MAHPSRAGRGWFAPGPAPANRRKSGIFNRLLRVTADGETLGAGYKGNGSLTVTGGAAVLGRYGYLGRQSGSTGTGVVRGPGSTWTCEVSMSVGSHGNGSLAVEAGGQVSNGMGFVGSNAGATGAVTVRGAGSTWTNHGSLYVGDGGDGSLTIEDGGEVIGLEGWVGGNVGSSGSVTVRGIGSKWTNEKNLYISRRYGTGSLTVEDGGEVTAAIVFASTEDLHGNGTITASDGAILDGHLVFDAEHASRAAVPFGSGGTLTVMAGGSYLGAGYNGLGSMTVIEGVAVESDYGYLGYGPESTGVATVCDPGSKWTLDSHLHIGTGGGVGILNVVAGGEVDSPLAHIGSQEGSTGVATVSGAGSKWQGGGALYIGDYGTGTLTVDAGAEAADSYGYIGHRSRSTGTVTIRGAGSKWTNKENLYVGRYGNGTLVIEAGAEVTNSLGYVGLYLDSSGAVTVRGSGSRWTNSEALSVGSHGTGSLTVEDGGEITAKTLGASLEDLHGNGRITVEGAVTDADFLFDAAHATGATVPFGSGGILTVTGGEGGLCAGRNGAGSVTIIEGVEVASDFGYVGLNSTSVGTATVSGTGSKWTNDGRLYVGEEGYGTLTVESGGEVSTSEAYIGNSAGAIGILTVHGLGSRWINGMPLHVGHDGAGTFVVGGGGTASAQELSVNDQSLLAIDIGYGSQLTVDNGTGTLENNGTTRLLAGPSPAAGSEHSPITAGTWTGSGTYQPLGGTWNATTHVFTVSKTLSGVSGQTIAIDLSDYQRALIEDTATGQAAGVSFLAKNDSGVSMDLTATALSPTEIAQFDEMTVPEGLVLGGWDFTGHGTGYDPDDPVYLSFAVPSALKRDDVTVWRFDGSSWTDLDPFDLTCAGGYASFTTEGLGVFAIAVPEPSVPLLLAIGLAFAVIRRGRQSIA